VTVAAWADKFFMHRISIHTMYYKIARDHASRYGELDSEMSELQTRGVAEEELDKVSRRIEACYEERERAAVVSITFAGMTVEAFFYDYAAETLGDNLVKHHLDKLDLKSKFIVYPRLVCGKSPEKGTHAYASLERLQSLRNTLVHFKSRGFRIDEINKASEFHTKLNEKIKDGVDNAVKSVMLVMEELDRLHGNSFFRIRME
jgi:hypothetical protein